MFGFIYINVIHFIVIDCVIDFIKYHDNGPIFITNNMATNFVYVCSFFILLNFKAIPAGSELGELTLTYKSENFMTEIAKNKHFVMFYAPWLVLKYANSH